jgi:RNA polymerase sigma-70 factor (ECF subfamily)
MPVTRAQQVKTDRLSDEELVSLARQRDEAAVRTITTRYNRRLFRIARSILRNDAEAEDVVQETYVRAFLLASTCFAAILLSAPGSPA